jgi:hypothetical protein
VSTEVLRLGFLTLETTRGSPPSLRMTSRKAELKYGRWPTLRLPGFARPSFARAGLLRCGRHANRRVDTHAFSAVCGPVGFDLDDAFDSSEVMPIAAPEPVFWLGHQSARYRVTVYVTKLLNTLAGGPNDEIVIALLPKRGVAAQVQRRETDCFNDWMTLGTFPRCGSPMSK